MTAGGQPAAGAFVSVLRRSGAADAPPEVLNGFRTDAAGRYRGTMAPGDYLVAAKLDGFPYDSGTSTPEEHRITVVAGAETVQDIALPDTARLRVTVVDGSGAAMPAKVSVVGFDPAPEPAAGGGTFVFRSNIDQQGRELFGIAAVRFLDQSGDSGAFPLAPADYEVVVSRGPEYSIHRERVSLASGATTSVNATLVKVVDTTGFVASDYHVHLINSFDCSVTRDDRIHTMAAEGVEYFVASDHDFITDLRPDIDRLGLGSQLHAVISSEITTFNLGHFNAWPLERDPGSYTGGAIDWGRAGTAVGKDFPSLGSFDLSPAELFTTVRNRISPGTGGGIIQVNHLNDSTLGFFTLAGIDTLANPPRSFTPPALIRQNPAIQNLYDDNYDTLELWIVGSRDQTSLLQDANLGDWFNLLNQGHIKTATADSDTHSTAIVQAGGPRNFVASSSDDPSELNDAELAASVRQGRLIASNAPFLRVTVEGDAGATAGLGMGESKLVAATSHAATLHLNIQSPAWAEFDTVELFANAVPVQIPDENLHGVQVPRYEAEPTLVLRAGPDFEVRNVVVDPEVPEARRLEANVDIPLVVDEDTWVVVLVKGTDGISRPIWPMNPQDLAHGRQHDPRRPHRRQPRRRRQSGSRLLQSALHRRRRQRPLRSSEAETMSARQSIFLRRSGLVLVALLLSGTSRLLAGDAPATGFFALLDVVPLVVTATVAERTENPALGVVVYELAVRQVLKGTAPADKPVVVEDLVFPSDRPTLATGEQWLVALEPLPSSSRYRSLLGEKPSLRIRAGRHGVRSAQASAVVQQVPSLPSSSYLEGAAPSAPCMRETPQRAHRRADRGLAEPAGRR